MTNQACDQAYARKLLTNTPANLSCFFLRRDKLSQRLSYALASVFYSVYGAIPPALGSTAYKYDVSSPVEVGQLLSVRTVLLKICTACGEQACTWRTALLYSKECLPR